ncbi:MAG: tRNA (N6-isopentenyl adenosine(37)-C2)-methylthiotransferase MiaB [Proteobacteria bacterium]|nr:tRNA (N6-isopentenyl adenosine(37)-C2)-methylthiotransferase MiaB [Pseudomonadota bacterium]NCA28660.1 tRNA (N6-isopentenyl adenosine(37)-C2)-methylthiotransferase MiaB [Pseudomonadota bacterium]
MTKKIHIKTYGCQMNVYDSDRMQDLMNSVGYENSDNVDDSDIVIINTCHIREKASEKLFSDLGRIKPFKEKMHENGKQMIVAVAGCVAQAEGQEIFKRSSVVDIIVGPESYQTLPDLVGKVIRDKSRQINLDFKPNNKFDTLPLNIAGVGASAFVTVQEGCDKFCTFCVVPYTRGAEYSRDVKKILYEINTLVEKGVSEIYLLGQNVNAYHGIGYDNNPTNLAKLIEEIAKIPEIKRIRYTTSHPRDMNDDLINAHRDIEKLMPFLHLPIQSGSNSVLKAMNRKHTRQDYFKIIEKLRKARPDMGLSSDFIVGFPNETEQDFCDTIDLVEKIGFTQCYSFKYSPRQGTPSADSGNQIDESIKDERLAILQKLLTKQQIEFNLKFEKTTMPILFEKEAPKSKKNIKDKNQDGKTQIWGKSPWLQSVVVEIENHEDSVNLINKIKNVDVIKSRPSSLIGRLIQ